MIQFVAMWRKRGDELTTRCREAPRYRCLECGRRESFNKTIQSRAMRMSTLQISKQFPTSNVANMPKGGQT
eukprot:1663262-Pyramimonas_sp.AAC.1